jgi:hypothetical protein
MTIFGKIWQFLVTSRIQCMGLSVSPDIFQEKMSELMTGLDLARAYLDDLLIISTETGSNKHLEKLEQVLNRLSEAGLKINAV